MVLDVVTIIIFAFGGAEKIMQKQKDFKTNYGFLPQKDPEYQMYVSTNMNIITEEPESQEASIDR